MKQLLEESSMKGIEDLLAYTLALNMMKLEFPNKFQKDKSLDSKGTTHKGTIEIVANLKIDKDEIYHRNIEINNKVKEYKIILRKATIKEWEKEQKNKEIQEEKSLQEHRKKDNNDFIKMLKGVGLILGLICIYFIVRFIFF